MNSRIISLPNINGFFDIKKNLLRIKTKKETLEIYLNKNSIKKISYYNYQDKVIKKINPNKCKYKIIGKNEYKRKVIHFLLPGKKEFKLRVGLTEHLGTGTWSSLPHKFENKLEKNFEEFFFYIFKNKPLEAIQVGKGVWHNNKKVDTCWRVKDKTFHQIPMGYHPVVGLPKVKVMYIWAYLAKFKRWEKI